MSPHIKIDVEITKIINAFLLLSSIVTSTEVFYLCVALLLKMPNVYYLLDSNLFTWITNELESLWAKLHD